MEPYWFLVALVMVFPQIEEHENKKAIKHIQPIVPERMVYEDDPGAVIIAGMNRR
jgi:hypothetical protein